MKGTAWGNDVGRTGSYHIFLDVSNDQLSHIFKEDRVRLYRIKNNFQKCSTSVEVFLNIDALEILAAF